MIKARSDNTNRVEETGEPGAPSGREVDEVVEKKHHPGFHQPVSSPASQPLQCSEASFHLLYTLTEWGDQDAAMDPRKASPAFAALQLWSENRLGEGVTMSLLV
jgi:hypothetical protein